LILDMSYLFFHDISLFPLFRADRRDRPLHSWCSGVVQVLPY
jgi:hypothetical protein